MLVRGLCCAAPLGLGEAAATMVQAHQLISYTSCLFLRPTRDSEYVTWPWNCRSFSIVDRGTVGRHPWLLFSACARTLNDWSFIGDKQTRQNRRS